jgi:hypothetical protein
VSTLEIVFPAYFDQEESVLRSKRWFADLTVVVGERRYRPVIYDPVQLGQEARDEIATCGVFTEPNLVVVAEVTRAAITAAITTLAVNDFSALIAEPR